MSVTSLGIDVGTTAVKCVIAHIDDDTSRYELLDSSYAALADVSHRAPPCEHGEQHVEQVLRAVHRAVTAIPQQQRTHATTIALCGQMHGIVWWRSADVCDHVTRLLASDDSSEWLHPHEQPAWSTLVTWQDQRCSPAFIRECTERVEQALAVHSDNASTVSPLATGYGLATFAHTLTHAPTSLSGFDACGTIMDLVAFVLCGHRSPSAAAIDVTNAFSWGGYDSQSDTWSAAAVAALDVPLAMLPTVKQSGDVVGHVADATPFALSSTARVFVPIGDHPSSVVAALAQQNHNQLTLVNFGTSAQLAMLLTPEEAATACSSASFELRPFVLPDQKLGVAASLSGGNVFAWFVAQCRDWMRELRGGNTNDTDDDDDDTEDTEDTEDTDLTRWYTRLIALGLAKTDTTLAFCPTLSGERADPNARGAIEQLGLANSSLGDLSAALCKGLVDNLFAMVPPSLQAAASTRPMIATGSALERNALLRHFLAAQLADATQQLQIQTAADAALGAVLTPVLLQRHRA